MRLLSLALLVALGGVGIAGDRVGKVIRIEQPPSREVYVPAGTFTMGVDDDTAETAVHMCELAFQSSSEELQPFQTPSGVVSRFCDRYQQELAQMATRLVYLSAFSIDRDEATVREYRRCIAAGACTLDALVAGDERYIRDEWPIVNVTWDEAQTYCRWRGGRLPTEAEWERAARGDDERVWPWGSPPRPGDFNHGRPRALQMREIDRAQSATAAPFQFLGDPDDSDGFALLAPPGSYPWGEGPLWGRTATRDQAGNVAEWTADARGYSDAKLGYADLPTVNPRRDGGLSDPRVVRGGSWRQPEFLGRANVRDPFSIVPGELMYLPTQRFSHVGFRCARGVDRAPESRPAPSPHTIDF
jgi:formylglycine-generating enzyme required for sulfatase activity